MVRTPKCTLSGSGDMWHTICCSCHSATESQTKAFYLWPTPPRISPGLTELITFSASRGMMATQVRLCGTCAQSKKAHFCLTSHYPLPSCLCTLRPLSLISTGWGDSLGSTWVSRNKEWMNRTPREWSNSYKEAKSECKKEKRKEIGEPLTFLCEQNVKAHPQSCMASLPHRTSVSLACLPSWNCS